VKTVEKGVLREIRKPSTEKSRVREEKLIWKRLEKL